MLGPHVIAFATTGGGDKSKYKR